MLCHGQGDPTLNLPGCCYLPGGTVCPMRWMVNEAGNVIDSNGVNVGSLDSAIRNTFGVNNPNIREQIKQFIGRLDGVGPRMFVCMAFGYAARDHWAEFMAQTGGVWGVSDEVILEQRWSEEYEVGGSATAVGDAWEAAGKPRNWCVTFGPDEGHCCFRETQQVNDTQAAKVTATRVSVSGRSTLGG